MILRSNRRLFYGLTFLLIFAVIVVFYLRKVPISELPELELDSSEASEFNISSQLKLPKTDYKTTLFNLTFKHILTVSPCNDSDNVLAVIIVTSHYNNVETRSAMRRSFPTEDLSSLRLKRVFLLGEAPNNVYVSQAAIVNESKRFGDIIQGTFQEAYRNLTYKHVMGLKWASENCKAAKYVVKMDDDIVINVKKVANLLQNLSLPDNVMAGYVLRDMKPIRQTVNKWHVTQYEYVLSKYPPFVSGWFYVTTPQIAARLVLTSHYFNYFWIDDVYVTGILAKNLKIKHFDLRQYFTVFPEFLHCCIADIKKLLECDVLIGPNGGSNNLFYEFNEAMKACSGSVCRRRVKPINETCVAERKVTLRRGDGIIETYNLH